MALNFTTGTEGIVQKDYHVFIEEADAAGLQAAIATYTGTPTKTNLDALVGNNLIGGLMKEVGELRKDSIEATMDDGDTVEGNTVGEIVMNKEGNFTAELLNTTAANIKTLEGLDRKSCAIVLLEKDTHKVDGNTVKTAILINNIAIKYTENITGGDIARSTFSSVKNVPSAGAYRHLADVVWT